MKKYLHMASWIFLGIIKLGLALLGLVVIPIALRFGQDSKSWPKIFWIWGNDEEECPDWWIDIKSTTHWWIGIWPCWWWYAIRNPVNNSRFIFEDRTPIVEGWGPESLEATDLITNKLQSIDRWVFSGPFAGYRKVWLKGNNKYSEIWFGWKVGSSVPGMGFTTQVRLNREIGT